MENRLLEQFDGVRSSQERVNELLSRIVRIGDLFSFFVNDKDSFVHAGKNLDIGGIRALYVLFELSDVDETH